MKEDTSTPTPEGASPNKFERGKPRTAGRDRAEAAIENLRREGGVFVEAVRATRMAMAVTDPNLPGNPIVFANKSFLRLSGYRMEEVLGQQPHFMNGPDTDAKDAARFNEALLADHDDIIETVQYRKNGSRFVATVLISAFKDEHGQTLNHFLSWLDVTRRVDAEDEVASLQSAQAALRESNTRHRLLIDSWAQAVWETDADGKVVKDSPSWREYTGQTLDEWLGDGWLDAIHPDDRDYAERQWREAVAARNVVTAEFRMRSPDGTWRWTNVRAAPVLNERGSIEKWAGMNIDIDDRKRAEKALRDSEERQAFLLELSDELRAAETDDDIERAAVGLLGRKLRASRVFYATVDEGGDTWSMQHDYSDVESGGPGRFPMSAYQRRRMAEWQAGEISQVADSETDPNLSADDRAAYVAFGARAAVGIPLVKAGRFAALMVINQATPRAWTVGEIALAKEAAERTWIEIERTRAENALRDSERHAQTLLAELQHRVRNTLAVVRSIARRTADNSESAEEMLAHFQGRLDAFSRVQAALTRSSSATVNLAALIEDEMVAHAAREGEQVSIGGPEVQLEPKNAERLSLAIHELTTNAVKHGAFAVSGGRIRVRWAVAQEPGTRSILRLSWAESGVTIDPSAARRQGFGLELLERSLPYELNAETAVNFRATGLHFELKMPLERKGQVG